MFKGLSFHSKKERSGEDLQLIRLIINEFGYRPKNVKTFYNALTHKSYSNSKEGIQSNERLEFLGDAILDTIVAEYLFENYPNEDEGFLTKIKSKVVSRQTLADIARAIHLGNFIKYQKGKSIRISTIEGNAFEALIGAIYLDSNFETVRKSIHLCLFKNHLNIKSVIEEEVDFKSKLFIWTQKNKLELEFKILTEKQIENSWEYEVIALINTKPYGKGVGNSKKSAEQMAAKKTFEMIGAD